MTMYRSGRQVERMGCPMVGLRSRRVMMLSVVVGIVGFTSVAYAQDQLPLQLKFALYSQAYKNREAFQADSHKVSPIEFADSGWTFRTDWGAGKWIEPHFENAECHSVATEANSGVTSCQLFSTAIEERKLMRADGWTCSKMPFNGTTKKFEFRWHKD